MDDTENRKTFPDSIRVRDTKLHDDLGGAGQRIYTTAGQGYTKISYVRGDLYKSLEARCKQQDVIIEVLESGLEAIKHSESKGQSRRIAIQALGQIKGE